MNSLLLILLGNSSQVSDGAGAVLLMRKSLALQKGLPIPGVFSYIQKAYAVNCNGHVSGAGNQFIYDIASSMLGGSSQHFLYNLSLWRLVALLSILSHVLK